MLLNQRVHCVTLGRVPAVPPLPQASVCTNVCWNYTIVHSDTKLANLTYLSFTVLLLPPSSQTPTTPHVPLAILYMLPLLYMR